MKPRVFMLIGLLAAVGICAILLRHSAASQERRALEKTQAEFRAQGFKVSLDEFDFSAPPELRARAATLTNFFFGGMNSMLLQPFQAAPPGTRPAGDFTPASPRAYSAPRPLALAPPSSSGKFQTPDLPMAPSCRRAGGPAVKFPART